MVYRDAAKRHEQSHDPNQRAKVVAALQCRRVLNRSCASCSGARIRCSGGQPCANCASKQLQCIYNFRKCRSPGHQQIAGRHSQSSSSSLLTNDPSHTSLVNDNVQTTSADTDSNSSSDDNRSAEKTSGSNGPELNSSDANSPTQGFQNSDGIYFGNTDTQIMARLFSRASTTQFTPPISQDLHSQCFVDINWLPFDPSLPTDMYFQDFETPEISALPEMSTSGIACGIERNPIDQGSHSMAALEIPMPDFTHNNPAAGKPATNFWANSKGPSTDVIMPQSTAEDGNFLYANGGGTRMSQADRALMERERHLSVEAGSAFSDHVPSWLSALQGQVNQLQSLSERCYAIPDGTIEVAISNMQPALLSDPCLGPYCGQSSPILQTTTWRMLIATYMKKFHRTHAFLEASLLCTTPWGWALCAATSAIGARYLCIPEMLVFSECLCKALYDALTPTVCLRAVIAIII